MLEVGGKQLPIVIAPEVGIKKKVLIGTNENVSGFKCFGICKFVKRAGNVFLFNPLVPTRYTDCILASDSYDVSRMVK